MPCNPQIVPHSSCEKKAARFPSGERTQQSQRNNTAVTRTASAWSSSPSLTRQPGATSKGRSSPKPRRTASASGMCSDDGHTLQAVTHKSASGCRLPTSAQIARAGATRAPASVGIVKCSHEKGGPSAKTLSSPSSAPPRSAKTQRRTDYDVVVVAVLFPSSVTVTVT